MSLLRYPRAAYRFATQGAYRSALYLRIRRPERLFQLSSYTRPDRYPDLFGLARREIGDGLDRSLLSFGCSTGEEAFALRTYFPLARIKGVDINRHSISVCRRRLARAPDPRIEFERADSVRKEPAGRYDAIFCMAVFRNGSLADPRAVRCDPLLTFSRFEGELVEIARCLKLGGLLFIAHSNFRFRDAPLSSHFELIARMPPAAFGSGAATPVFDRQNSRTPEVNHDEVAFRKVHDFMP